MDPQDMKAIAEGRQPRQWTGTFTHPVHGELTFRASLPKALALARQSVEMDNLLQPLVGEARMNTLILCSAISGLKTLIELPVYPTDATGSNVNEPWPSSAAVGSVMSIAFADPSATDELVACAPAALPCAKDHTVVAQGSASGAW